MSDLSMIHGGCATRFAPRGVRSGSVRRRATITARRLLAAAFLCAGLVTGPALAADLDIHRIRSGLDRNAQEQQFVRQQIQLTQGQLRAEESRRLIMQSYIRLSPASRRDLIGREPDSLPAFAHQQPQDLDALAARYRDLERERRRLVQRLSAQTNQPAED